MRQRRLAKAWRAVQQDVIERLFPGSSSLQAYLEVVDDPFLPIVLVEGARTKGALGGHFIGQGG